MVADTIAIPRHNIVFSRQRDDDVNKGRRHQHRLTPEQLLARFETALDDEDNREFLRDLPSGLSKNKVRLRAEAELEAAGDRASDLAHLYEVRERRSDLFWPAFQKYEQRE